MYSNHVPRLLARSLYNDYLDNYVAHRDNGIPTKTFTMKDINGIRQTMGLSRHRKKEGFELFVFAPQKEEQAYDVFLIATPAVKAVIDMCYTTGNQDSFGWGSSSILWQLEFDDKDNEAHAATNNIFTRNMRRIGCQRYYITHPMPPSFFNVYKRDIIRSIKSMKRWYENIKQDEDGTNLNRLFETVNPVVEEEVVVEGHYLPSFFHDDSEASRLMREGLE